MTTEDDFQAALDLNGADWQTRLVFADWLEERGDERADGYRAMGLHRVNPLLLRLSQATQKKEAEIVFLLGTDGNDSPEARAQWGKCMLPAVWFKKLPRRDQKNARDSNPWWRFFVSRRFADDTAALAFTKLAKVRRDELLDPTAATPAPAEPKPAAPKKKRSKKA